MGIICTFKRLFSDNIYFITSLDLITFAEQERRKERKTGKGETTDDCFNTYTHYRLRRSTKSYFTAIKSFLTVVSVSKYEYICE